MGDTLAALKMAVDVYQAQYTATDKLWAYFSTVSLALVAFTISSDKVTRVWPHAVVATVAYLIFCAGNFSALLASQRQLQAFALLVHQHGRAYGVDASTFPVFAPTQIARFYWTVVMVIVVASLGLARFRERANSADSGAAASAPPGQ